MLTIETKEDSAEKLAAVAGKPTKNYLFAQEVNQIIASVNEINLALNPDRILTLGTETIEDNEYSYIGYSWQIQGQSFVLSTPVVLTIPYATPGFKRKDISVFTTDGNILRVAGTETNDEVVTTPDVPPGTLYFKSYDIDGGSIEVDPEPPAVSGDIYKKKIENTRWKSTQSGTNVIIPFQASGQMHYSVVHSGLVSVAGFSTASLTTPLYEGQDVLFENQTGNPITLKDMFGGVSTPFNFGADLVVPNGGKLWLKVRNNEIELILKSWDDPIDLSTKADLVAGKVPSSQLPSYVDDVLEFANLAAFPATGETGKIYLAIDTNKTYRWSGSAYVQLSIGIDFPSDGKTYGVKDGLPIEILDELYRSWFSYMPNNAGSWLVVNSGNPLSVYGTSTVVPRSGSSIYGSIIMNNCVSATPNGSNAGIKNNNSSDGVYREGVDAYFVWANNDSNNQCCTAVGLYSLLLAVPNLNPSNFTASTMICANDQGDANLSFIVNRTAATASFIKIDCGSNFPANSTTDAYLLRIQINKTENQAQRIGKMTIYNIVTGNSFSYDFTGTQMPDSNANFAVMINRGNRNTGIATNVRPSKIHVTRKLF